MLSDFLKFHFLFYQKPLLLIEDVGERHYHIDRMIRNLKMSGVLAHCKGIILGDFTDCNNDVGYESVEAMLRQ
ncbi:MAG: hypothetical protein II426_00345, partial [Methanobrevibacter sp.]|nr:hypothetical protein [Methanobrevibacter sp.]